MRVNILNLAAYDVTHIEETEHDYHITTDTINSPQPANIVGLTIWLVLVGVIRWLGEEVRIS